MPRTLTASDRKSLIRLASVLPKGSPERRDILAGLKAKDNRDITHKTAADITDKLYDTVRNQYHAFEQRMDKTLQAYLARFGKGLLKLDFVMDQRKSYINYYTDREGIYPEGELHFIDKRDHQQRDRYAVEADLQKLGLWGSVMGDTGMWKIRFGGK